MFKPLSINVRKFFFYKQLYQYHNPWSDMILLHQTDCATIMADYPVFRRKQVKNLFL